MLCRFALVSLVFASACASSPSTDSRDTQQATAATQYIDIGDFNSSAYQDVWYALGSKLNTEFTAACTGTWCAGTYANLTPLTVMCSVSSVEGIVHDCAWTFGASRMAVDGTTAQIAVDAPTFECHFKASGTAGKLVALLDGASDALHTALPGGTTSIADTLDACFAHPLGGTPIASPAGATYVDAGAYYASAASQQKWAAAQAAVVAGFNAICGDTFCSSDYADLSSLQLTCAVTDSTGNIKSCAWTFAGSITDFDSKGNATPGSKSWTCPIAVAGTLPQLISTLTDARPAGSPDPIDRALPGTTTSTYDAIANCLP